MIAHIPYPAPHKQQLLRAKEYLNNLVHTVLPHAPTPIQQLFNHARPLLPTLDHLTETQLVHKLTHTLKKPQMTIRRFFRELRNTSYDLTRCFRVLLACALRYLPRKAPIYLALDATTLKNRFVILTIALLYRNTALPIAWRVVPAYQKGSWNTHWCALLHALRGVIPAKRTVWGLTDRGWWSPVVYEAIRQNGWHPLMRLHAQGYFREKWARGARPITDYQVARGGACWEGWLHQDALRCVLGVLFPKNRLFGGGRELKNGPLTGRLRGGYLH